MYLLSILKAQGRDRKGGLMKDPTLTMPAYRRNHYQDPKFQQQYMCLGHKSLPCERRWAFHNDNWPMS